MLNVAVFGSAHLDMLGQAFHNSDSLDRPGRISIEIGGTGFNVAVNMTRAGADVTLCTALKASPFSEIIVGHLRTSGVRVEALVSDGLPTSGFVGVVEPEGELMAAVTGTAVERALFTRRFVEACLKEADIAVIDCNLSVLSIRRVAGACLAAGLPFVVAATSEEKVVRARPVLDKAAALFLNKAEYVRLLSTGRPVAQAQVTIVTLGQDGVLLKMPEGEIRLPAPDLSDRKGNLLGLGDMLLALSVTYRQSGMAWPEAVRQALSSLRHVAARDNCNVGATEYIELALRRLQSDATTDYLTGLLNRRAVLEKMAQAKAGRRKGGACRVACLIDIDHFKSINDTYGHDSGDIVLRWLAAKLRSFFRDTDLVARWGGEEFLIIMQDLTLADAWNAVNRLRERISVESVEDGMPRRLTLSAGVAELGQDFDASVKRADEALYEAKSSGRNAVVSK